VNSSKSDLSGHGLAAQAHYKLVEKLAESEHRFRELVELQRDIVFRCDGSGVLEYMSPAVHDTLGVPPEACVGRPLEELVESADPDARRRARLILQGVPQAQGSRFRFRATAGRSRWLELQARQRLGGGSVGILRDVTEVVIHERERSRLHAELVERNAQLKVQDRRREEQAAALRHRYDLQEVLTHISARMLEAPHESIDAAIEDALGEVGRFMGVDRAYVFLYHGPGRLMSNTHEWCAEEITSEKEGLQELPQEAFPWWVAELEAGRSIVVPDLDALPPEASAERAILADQGIQSAVVVPLVSRGRSSGFVGFDAVHHPRSWDADVIALLALVGDILLGALEHARSEQLREESAARYRLLADNARDMIWRTDLDLRFEFVNPAVKRLLQREPEELAGGTIERICDSKTHRRMREWLERARAEHPAEEAAVTLTHEVQRQDGTTVAVETVASFVLDETGSPVAVQGTTRDITERVEVERMKSQFVASVSHELRTPLTSIMGFARTLLSRPDLGEDERQEFMGIIHTQSERLHHLIEDILEISRIESGERGLRIERVDLPGIAGAVVVGLRTKAEAGGVDLRWTPPERPHPAMSGDAARLRSVVENLTDNAIKFTPEGGTVEVQLEAEDAAWELTVRDSGLGIPSDQLERVFERFHRVARPGLEIPGTGLGLAIVREIVHAHGGTISVSSTPGEGTCFRATLPFEGPG